MESGSVKGDGGGNTDKWAKQYYTSAPGQIKAKIDIGVYAGNDVDFNKRLSKRKKGTVIPIKGIKKAKNDLPRLVTSKGNLVTANKSYVKAFKWSDQYYTSNPGKVKLKLNAGVFGPNDVELKKKLSYRKAGTVIPIKGVKTASNGQPCLVTSGGNLITANKKYVKQVATGIPSKGTFTNGSEPVQVRRGSAGLNAPKAGKLPAKSKVTYTSTVKRDGYTWIKYTGSSGNTLYCPVAKGSNKYGTFK
ncbi:MAG: DUF5776 domain-containing protein [Tetragenococcus koreensis]|nr:DUF5776 domain-containing protein [Tetragenococcus koreensis]